MRKGILAGLFSALVFVLLAAPATADVHASVSISAFHDTLAPHGRWIVTRSYGDVWVPAGIDASWQPYWNGEWVWTDYGWTWVSYDPWGDIPFHYGTWTWVDGDGWAWIPGTVWAPAWVTWAWTDNCIGWAPVPASFALSATGYFGSPVVLPASRYVFVSANQFVASPIRSARLAASRNATLLASARTATRFGVSGGVVRTTADPPPAFVQKASGRHLQTVSIEHARTRPTTVAAVAHGGHIGVVAPARERAAMNVRESAKEQLRSTSAARSTTIRHTPERSSATASVHQGSRSSSHAPVRVETNSHTGSPTVTNTRTSRTANRKVSKPSAESANVKHSTHARSAGSAETSASRAHSAPAHEPIRKPEAHTPAKEARAPSAHPAPAPPQVNREHEAHAAPAEHPAPHAAPPARQAPPPKQPKQHPPKPKDQDHS